MTTAIIAGMGLVVVAYGGKAMLSLCQRVGPTVAKHYTNLINSPHMSMKAYYKGGFETNMSRREAGLVLGISPASDIKRVRQAHRRIMLLNHPDRGGSPYLAAKINEAKGILEGTKRSA